MNTSSNTPSASHSIPQDPHGLFRTLKFDLAGQDVAVLSSPFDFSKKTTGAAAAVEYLLDDRGIVASIEATGAAVRRKIIELGVPMEDTAPDPNIRHKDATIDIAIRGGNEIETAIKAGSKVLMVRGAHDAMDLSGVLRATNGNVGIVIVDTHADIHTPSTSTSKNPHGMWVSALLGDGEGLSSVMEGTPQLRPENIIYIGLSQLEEAEVSRLQEKNITVFTGHNLDPLKIAQALDVLQTRVPLWLDIDEDAMVNAAATMPGGMVSAELLKTVANRIGTNQKCDGMHTVLGVGLSEFQLPDKKNPMQVANAEYQADVLKAAVHQALGAGYPEDSTDEGPKASMRSSVSTIRKMTGMAAALLLTTLGSFFLGKNTSDVSKPENLQSSAVSAKMNFLPKDASYAVTGMSGESVFLPIITHDWKMNPVDSFTRDFDIAATRFQNALSRGDSSSATTAEREMLTYVQAALLHTYESPVLQARIMQHVCGRMGDAMPTFDNAIASVQSDTADVAHLQDWMKTMQVL